eukprot:TRINITY_DN36912_c0_g1_i1.p1 TRINITY_DN36912_c0_g1~~TRINITY_DN36912_c0_g1_i1.p1  ORF type:complete len:282 (+),score=34.78 TRINITY_DN36912_c0_g1_i1:151-996(+)
MDIRDDGTISRELVVGSVEETLGIIWGAPPPRAMAVEVVEANTWAASQGVMERDELVKIDSRVVSTMSQQACIAALGRRPVHLTFVRKGLMELLRSRPLRLSFCNRDRLARGAPEQVQQIGGCFLERDCDVDANSPRAAAPSALASGRRDKVAGLLPWDGVSRSGGAVLEEAAARHLSDAGRMAEERRKLLADRKNKERDLLLVSDAGLQALGSEARDADDAEHPESPQSDCGDAFGWPARSCCHTGRAFSVSGLRCVPVAAAGYVATRCCCCHPNAATSA